MSDYNSTMEILGMVLIFLAVMVPIVIAVIVRLEKRAARQQRALRNLDDLSDREITYDDAKRHYLIHRIKPLNNQNDQLGDITDDNDVFKAVMISIAAVSALVAVLAAWALWT